MAFAVARLEGSGFSRIHGSAFSVRVAAKGDHIGSARHFDTGFVGYHTIATFYWDC